MQNSFYVLKNTAAVCVGILLLFFSCFSLHLLPQEQPQPPEFKSFTLSDGLPDLTTNTIFQDKSGFLWLGTDKGLVKYDGYKMVTYKPDASKPFGNLRGREIRAICEDNENNLWVGTEDGGLNRYDRKTNSFSCILDNGIRFLYTDKRGCIWYITDEEYPVRMDYKAHEAKRFKDYKISSKQIVRMQINSMTFYAFLEDQKGLIWFGVRSGGLVCYNPETDRSTWIPVNPGEKNKAEIVRDICEDSLGTLWISTENGRLKYLQDRQNNTFASIDRVAGNQAPPWGSEPIWRLFPDSKNRLWLTTPKGLFCFETGSGKVLYHFKHDPGDKGSLSDNVSAPIYEDKEGKLWFISWGDKGGIKLLNPDNGKIQPTSLSDSLISSLFKDRFGVLWIGVKNEGLFKYMEPLILKFRHFSHEPTNPNSPGNDNVTVIYESPSTPGIFWIGTEKGLNKFDHKTNTVTRVDSEKRSPNGLSYNKVTALCEDNRGIPWIGTVSSDKTNRAYAGGLDKYDPRTKIFTPYHLQAGTSKIRWTDNWIDIMFKGKDGMLWMGTRYDGLYLFDPDKGERDFVPYKSDIDSSRTLSDNEISVVYEDNRGTLWIGTYNGKLNRFNKIENNFKSYSPQDVGPAAVTTILEDHIGNFWIGTAQDGVHLFDRNEGETLARFTTREGLPNDLVNAVLEDNQGYLWIISGNEFLSKFNPQTKEFIKHYGSSDKLWEKDSIDVALKNLEGEFLMGGRNGFYIFNPQNSSENTIPPQITLTGFQAFDKPVALRDNLLPREPISAADRITLTYEQNDIFFDYTVIHFMRPDRNRCQYKLEGRDTDWVMAAPSGAASYKDLSPGEYTLKIKGANGDGLWSSEEKLLTIIIEPPFWNTWWFKMPVLFLVVMIVMLYMLNRARNKQIQIIKQKRNLENMVTRRTAALKKALDKLKRAKDQLVHSEKMAALGNLTVGIAHEIKNPLNFVVNFAELSIDLSKELQKELGKEKDKLATHCFDDLNQILAKLEENLDRIQQHGNRIDTIVSGMLLHSRGKQGEFQEVDLNNLIKENTELVYHSLRARDSAFNLHIQYELDNTIGIVHVVPQDFSRAVLNILNNACYAVNEKRTGTPPDFSPSVAVRTKNHKSTVEIIIWDNGTGIPESDLKKIFAPYYTTKPVGEGTGLGLSIARDIIVREHKGEIKPVSVEGEFTEFIITIPRNLEIKETGINS